MIVEKVLMMHLWLKNVFDIMNFFTQNDLINLQMKGSNSIDDASKQNSKWILQLLVVLSIIDIQITNSLWL